MAKISSLTDNTNQIVYPQTKANAVIMEDSTTVENAIAQRPKMVLSAEEPASTIADNTLYGVYGDVGQITTGEIADSAVTTAKIASSAVTEAKLGTGAVTTAKIANGAVTGVTNSATSIGSAKLALNTVGTPNLRDGAVTSSKIDWSTIEYHHNALYRGKNLGTSVTTAQWNAIKNGTFDDMFIGDYWVINGVTWRIANFDYWLNMGDRATTAHHVVIVPDSNLYMAQMNTSNVTTGAYAGSKMYTDNLTTAKTTVNNAFGSAHVLSHRDYFQNSTSGAYENGGAWFDSTVDLMSEKMVYGCDIYHGSAMNNGAAIPNLYTIDHSQLALFRLDHSRICNRTGWWLRDVVSSFYFAFVSSSGAGTYGEAPVSSGVRPAFAIYQA